MGASASVGPERCQREGPRVVTVETGEEFMPSGTVR